MKMYIVQPRSAQYPSVAWVRASRKLQWHPACRWCNAFFSQGSDSAGTGAGAGASATTGGASDGGNARDGPVQISGGIA